MLAPVIDRADRLEQFTALVSETPEVLARATVESLGAPDPPADVEPHVAQRAVRHHCISLLRRSAAAPPMACDARLAQLLRGPAYADFERAWTAVREARPEARATTLDALLRALAQGRSLDPRVAERFRALPAPERAAALRRALARPVDPAVLPALRAELSLAAPGASLAAPGASLDAPAPAPASPLRPPPRQRGGGSVDP